MHGKSDSDVPSLGTPSSDQSFRRPVYFVQSPSQQETEKTPFHSSSLGSPNRYHCSPVHHSRESSATRFSVNLKLKPHTWKKIEEVEDEEDENGERVSGFSFRFPVFCFLLCFGALFALFSLILCGVSQPFKPQISMKTIVFEEFNIQAGIDSTAVPTKMLSINSTVRFSYRNIASFFSVHVTSSPLELYYSDLKIASGNIHDFRQERKSDRMITTVVIGQEIPLYGGGLSFGSDNTDPISVPLILKFSVKSKAHVFAKVVKPKFRRITECSVTFRPNWLSKEIDLRNSCTYYDQ